MAGSQALQGTLNNATGAIDQGRTGALGWLTGAGPNSAVSALGTARGDLGTQYGQTQDFLRQAYGMYAPVTTGGQGLWNSYLDATGANGAAGNQRALSSFTAGPGYTWARDQGLDAIERTAASRGQLAGGNTTADLLKYSTGLANQTWGDYISRMQPGLGLYSTGLGGQAGVAGNQATASQNYGNSLSALDQALAGVYGNAGNIDLQSALAKSGLISGIGQQQAQLTTQGLTAGQNAAQNSLSALFGLGGIFAGLGGKSAGTSAGGGTSWLSRLFGG